MKKLLALLLGVAFAGLASLAMYLTLSPLDSANLPEPVVKQDCGCDTGCDEGCGCGCQKPKPVVLDLAEGNVKIIVTTATKVTVDGEGVDWADVEDLLDKDEVVVHVSAVTLDDTGRALTLDIKTELKKDK